MKGGLEVSQDREAEPPGGSQATRQENQATRQGVCQPSYELAAMTLVQKFGWVSCFCCFLPPAPPPSFLVLHYCRLLGSLLMGVALCG